MGKQAKSDRIFQNLYIDLLGSYPCSKSGHIGIIIVLDHKSKYPFLEPIKKFTANVITEFLEKCVFHVVGVPERITSDNGVQFKSVLFKNRLANYGISHNFTAVYSPQANASERVNRSIIAAIRAYVKPNHKNWDEKLSDINCALRSSFHSSIGFSPYFVVFGQIMILNGKTYPLLRRLELLTDPNVSFSQVERFKAIRDKVNENVTKAFEKYEKSYNLRTRAVTFEIGQTVYHRSFAQSSAEKHFSSKLANQFIKAKIYKRHGNSIYELEDFNGKKLGKFHAKDLRA